MKKLIVFLFFTTSIAINAQAKKSFWELSAPIKTWVIFHPFKAKKALKISIETNRISDSIKKSNALDGDAAGGQVDAFRHAYWMAKLRQKIGKRAARSLGKAHEKENYLTYKKRKLEDGILPDEISSIMDLHNNDEGLKLTKRRGNLSRKSLVLKIIKAIKSGKMKIIKKDTKGNFLTCSGKLIYQKSLKGKWENTKCLVASNLKP